MFPTVTLRPPGEELKDEREVDVDVFVLVFEKEFVYVSVFVCGLFNDNEICLKEAHYEQMPNVYQKVRRSRS